MIFKAKPAKINFESSTGCNARCTFCPRYDMTRKMGEMSDELFYKIIKEGREMGVSRYSPFMNGDPFVFPRIWKWLDYMQKERVWVALYTNGQFVDVERLAKYNNILYLDFSVNAATPATHKKLMRGPVFQTVLNNYNKAKEICPFKVRASFVTVQDNVAELSQFKKMFPGSKSCGFANWTGDRHDPLERKGKQVPCWILMHQMFILWDGTVVPCCMDYDGKQPMGDANKENLKDIWIKSNWLREKHMNYDFTTPVCSICNYNVV